MADEDEFDEFEQAGEEPERTNAEWAAFRREKQAAKRAAQERDEAKRELAFMRAGLDTGKDPRLAYFVKGYDGEVTPEAIRKAAEDAGFIEAPQTGPTPEQQEALAASARIDAASSGATPPMAAGEAAALADLDAAYTAAGAAGVMAKLAEHGILPAAD